MIQITMLLHPYELTNNEFSILDVADVVMMDPVGTGLSVPYWRFQRR